MSYTTTDQQEPHELDHVPLLGVWLNYVSNLLLMASSSLGCALQIIISEMCVLFRGVFAVRLSLSFRTA
eukprot:1696912-Amphidinium_carterae.1